MAIIGVVCEYNPFHRGHLLQLETARAALGEDSTVLCVMSGDFVQRGEPAVYTKLARAEAACRCGADLVVELPLPWCLSSAEGFARGAVGLLGALGATHLSFGSETGDLESLEALAAALGDGEITGAIKQRMAAEGSLSFAAAREQVLREQIGEQALLLRNPNDILAVEYLKAIRCLGLKMTPLPVLRRGAGHDEAGTEVELPSASALRACLREGKSLAGRIPSEAEAVFTREKAAGRELSDPALLELALLSRLRMLEEADFAALPDGGDGLGLRLYEAVSREASLEAILSAAKTKRYALARLRRMCWCAGLGLRAGSNAGTPPYARVLATNARGRGLLRQLDGRSGVPLVTKPAVLRALGGAAETVFDLGARAHDLYVLGFASADQRRAGEDWRSGPRILETE